MKHRKITLLNVTAFAAIGSTAIVLYASGLHTTLSGDGSSPTEPRLVAKVVGSPPKSETADSYSNFVYPKFSPEEIARRKPLLENILALGKQAAAALDNGDYSRCQRICFAAVNVRKEIYRSEDDTVPIDGGIRWSLAESYLFEGRFAEADDLIGGSRWFGTHTFDYAWLKLELGDIEGALAYLPVEYVMDHSGKFDVDIASVLPEPTDVPTARALILLARGVSSHFVGRDELAVRFLEIANDNLPGNPAISYYLGRSLQGSGRYSDALPYYEIAASNTATPDLAWLGQYHLRRCSWYAEHGWNGESTNYPSGWFGAND